MDDKCDKDDCNNKAVGDVSITHFHVQFCNDHREYFMNMRASILKDLSRKRGR